MAATAQRRLLVVWEGATVKLRVRFRDPEDPSVLVDVPEPVTISVRAGEAGPIETPVVTHEATGTYSARIVADEVGMWYWRATSGGVEPSVAEGEFEVRPSRFV